MASLAFQMCAPMASFVIGKGYESFESLPYPSKSAVVGLIANALGRTRDDDNSDIATLRMGVRLDRPPRLRDEFQIARNIPSANGKILQTALRKRRLVHDLCALVVLEGQHDLLEQINTALAHPKRPLSAGLRGFLFASPLVLPDGLSDESLETVLQTYPWLPSLMEYRDATECPVQPEVTFVVERDDGDLLADEPRGSTRKHRFGFRRVLEVTSGIGQNCVL